MSITSHSKYISSVIWAEMRKSVTYRVDIHIKNSIIIYETQCECAVGQGPNAHCKHVGAVLYTLQRFKADCIEYVSELTCTQKLQSFHQAKKYRGTPKKDSQLMIDRGLSVCFDPRPSVLDRNNYRNHFRSVVLNYEGEGMNMPVKHIFQPANPYAITNDHDYVTASETFFLMTSSVSL